MKKILIGFSLILALFIITGCNEEKENKDVNKNREVENQDGELICTKTEEIDGVNTNFKATISYENNTVINVRNETQVDVTPQNKNTYIETYNGLKNIYGEINGVNITTQSTNNTVTSIFETNYELFDEEKAREVIDKLGLDEADAAVVVNRDYLDLETYKNRYLNGYNCND